MGTTKIPWADMVWNPISGCSKCSLGCLNCYAERMAKRLAAIEDKAGRTPKYGAVVDKTGWMGNVICDESVLDQPIHWRKPRRIFPCSMSDLFHEKVPDKFIGNIFEVIRKTPRHTYLILTKRAERMCDVANRLIAGHGDEAFNHVQWVTSISTQAEADEKIPILLQITAAVRGLSIEPMLELIDVASWGWRNTVSYQPRIDWVVVGCEKIGRSVGRPCKIEWIESIVDQCQAANVPVFVKQINVDGKVVKMPKDYPQDLPERR